MTPYFNTLPPEVQARLRPLLPTMQQAAQANGIPVDLIMSIAVKESQGKADIIGDKHLKRKAYGLYQVRYPKEWLGNADPMNPTAATTAIAPSLARIYKDCDNDPACVHFKFNAGQGQAYTPENVKRITDKFPHVRERLDSISKSFGSKAAPLPPKSPAEKLAPYPTTPATPPTFDFGPAAQLWDAPQPMPEPTYAQQQYDPMLEMARALTGVG